ncbi:D-3-phosphoglycerate dehydrogenase [Arboricoccus pini]|uniref:D-3-phosphoglycerate dehydrogenase n=1 Tax=Arboricoccus pini TaxID=1963835 RepID=A0A212RQM1_9PROT|nr:2-hydroxyacid dehydrogenase [Arboricoccus pini]SNB74854.1 D-3-phosphoglycerate dehydrogenase [Arboricoccus pini]
MAIEEKQVAIIGDRFMLPAAFKTALEAAGGEPVHIRALELDWPDSSMHHGYAGGSSASGLENLREYVGEPDAIADFIGDAGVLITHLAPITRPMLERLPQLKLIAVSRGGPVNIDAAACRKAGVRLVNCPGRNASAVAEFTIGAILAETRLIRAGHEALREGVWRGDLYRADTTGPELSECTVGLIGYGEVGCRVTKLLAPFGCRILVADPYKQLDDIDRAAGIAMVNLHDLLAASDIVSLHARVTDETRGFMNKAAFAAMKPSAWFINTARGPMVNYDDLYVALKGGTLRGAMLETFWQEPVPADAPLLKLPNVTLTPHIAGASTTTVKIAARMVAEEVRRFWAGEPALHPFLA